ncbi:MucR family transcriptional regulator [Komagataeibacter saccharivorans]|uniref:MucR family transcriptional regulator n=1 Tax=Komagataeibacter saccharivorans TaxID=265959 RepID=UPI0035709C17
MSTLLSAKQHRSQRKTAAFRPSSPQPAVPVEQSVFPDYIVCLENGKKLKMLKRHLQTRYGMTPTQYREKWQLPMELSHGCSGVCQKAGGSGTRRGSWT